ncbi:stage III sporulation protein AE [Geobacillus sp. NFOSA3]|nr:stage III sporulation protein AE [Geobacillus sp. NFOSA3]OQP02749.1 stage III sporulation protein AE [Geobacillus sp. 44C]PDM41233.1 stage III sporulation protein AE [Parageobacillus yumthangensis]PUF89764.1 stage III sporulation protein AE [Geobacillus sp. LYN3]RDV22915.1 stage III sporulation protein AE [Parageobacillus toebii]TXK88972.1 stage III sporulation protein AE [Geobacillus sp. AYS3]
MKEKVVMVVGLFFFFLSPFVVQASSPNDQLVQKQMEQLDISEIRQYWEDIVTKYGGFLPESQKGSIAEFLSGEKQLSLKEWLIAFGKFLFYELQANGKLLGTLILLTVFSMVLQSLQNAFEQQTVSKVAYAVVYMVLLIIALNSFRVAMDYALDAVQTMSHFMIAMIPLLLALLASSGGVISAAFFHPIILFLMNTTGTIVEYVTLPLLFLAALLSIVSTLTDHYKVTQLAELLTKVGIGILGVILTIFLGVMSVKGATSAIADGIALRTAKFVTGNFIPVVGKMFTDAADTVVTASMLLKNTVGIVGVVILFIIAAFPALKIFAIAFIYKVSAAVMQPLGGGPVISCLSIMSKSIAYVFASLAIVSLMFFLSLTIIITAGNITMMVR